MQKNLVRKGLVIGIIVLFFGASVTPSISGYIENLNRFSNIINDSDFLLEASKSELSGPAENIEDKNLKARNGNRIVTDERLGEPPKSTMDATYQNATLINEGSNHQININNKNRGKNGPLSSPVLWMRDEIPFYKQDSTEWCWAACLAMHHQWFSPKQLGNSFTQQSEIVKYIHHDIVNKGAYLDEVEKVMKHWHNINSSYENYQLTYANNGELFQVGPPTGYINDPKTWIKYLQSPVLAFVDTTGDDKANHVELIVGYDDENERVWIYDPQNENGYHLWYPYGDYNNRWDCKWNRGNPFDRRGMAAGIPGDDKEAYINHHSVQLSGTIYGDQLEKIFDIGLGIGGDNSFSWFDSFGESYENAAKFQLLHSIYGNIAEPINKDDFWSVLWNDDEITFKNYYLAKNTQVGNAYFHIDPAVSGDIWLYCEWWIHDEDDRTHIGTGRVQVYDDRDGIDTFLDMMKPKLKKDRKSHWKVFNVNDVVDPSVPPGGDRPDETFDVSTPQIFNDNNFNENTRADIAVLYKGFPTSTAKLLEDLDEPYTFVRFDLPDDLIEDHPILVIPSGGLYGLDSSPTFKSKLEDYVEDGGTLIVFTQQHGYEYKALPGDIGGFGWLEDQSCHYRSVYMDNYHQILSSQDSVVSDAYVDGSFTSYPENTSVLLKRTKNGMPALLMYEYGNGVVIASTLYTDWAYPRGQATSDGINIVRDMIEWGRNPIQLEDFSKSDNFNISVNVTNYYLIPYPEYSEFELSDTVNIAVNVTNQGNETSDSVSFKVLDPDYEMDYVNISISIPPNETTIVNFTYPTSNTSKQGYYHLLYSLYANETLVGPEDIYVGGFALGINTSNLSICTVNFTLINPDEEITEQEIALVSVPPGETMIVNFTCTNLQKLGIWRLEYEIFDYLNNSVESGVKKFAISKYAENPDGFVYQGTDISFIITSPDEHYLYGSDVPFTIHVYNHADSDRNIHFNTYYKDWSLRTKLSDQEVSGTLSVPAGGNASFTHILHVGDVSLSYNQLIIYGSFSENGNNLGRTEKVIWMSHPSINVHDVETDKVKYAMGENVSVSMSLTNNRDVTCNPEMLVRVLDPHNNNVFEDSFPVTLNASETINEIINFTLPIPLGYGIYLVVVDAYFDGRKIGSGSTYFEIDKSYIVRLTLDKSNGVYKVRENMSVDLEITNVGSALWSTLINVSIPILSFEDSTFVSLETNQTETIRYDLNIPETTSAGTHDIIVTVEIDGYMKQYYFVIPNSKLILSIDDGVNYEAGKYFNITVKNIGGVDTVYKDSIEFSDSKGFVLYRNDSVSAENITAGENKTIGFQIPKQVVSGIYVLYVDCKDLITNETTTVFKTVIIDGLETLLTVSTDKTCYFKNETIRATTNIINLNGDIKNATLYLKVYPTEVDPYGPIGPKMNAVYSSNNTSTSHRPYKTIRPFKTENASWYDKICSNGLDSDSDNYYNYDGVPIRHNRIISKIDTGISTKKTDYSSMYEVAADSDITKTRSTIYVDDDNTGGPWNGTIDYPYQFIQDGINAAGNGDTVFVFNGTYYENLGIYDIYNNINLIGEDKNTTIIDGNRSGFVVLINTFGVTITGFTIQNSASGAAGIVSHGWDITICENIISQNYYGIHIDGVIDSNITRNTIMNNNYGILISLGSPNINISENTITANNFGIRGRSTNNTFRNNVITNNNNGIYLTQESINNIISGNNIRDNEQYGIKLGYSSSDNNISRNNIIYNKGCGILLDFSNNNIFYHNNFIYNERNALEGYSSLNNSWDNGYPSGGNYWSDYAGSDNYNGPDQDIPGSDGIGDTPYDIPNSGNNQDRYPLMNVDQLFVIACGPYLSVVNETIQFNGLAAGGSPPYLWQWDFGDGNTSSEQNPYHAYSIPGFYTATLTLIDSNDSSCSDGVLVTIIHLPYSHVWVDDDFNQSIPGWQVDHFDIIQDAIDLSGYEGTINVNNGTYHEQIIIDKTINLIGENRNTTIIDMFGIGGGNDVIYISANSVNITGFTILNSEYDWTSCGIYIYYSDYNTICENIITGNGHGIYICESMNNNILGNIVINNNNGIYVGGFALGINITGNTIVDNNLYGDPCNGIIVKNSENIIISGNIIEKNYDGIWITGCINSIISKNEIIDNSANGVHLGNSHNCIIWMNNITNNSDDGIELIYSSENSISLNNIVNNSYGIEIRDLSNYNVIYHNNISSNNQSAYDECSNTWDHGYPPGGNYWSDYTGSDNYNGPNQDMPGSDGIGDTPYNVSGNTSQDTYPLMQPLDTIPPIVSFTYLPVSPTINQTIEFNASSSYDMDGIIINWTWDFGDGNGSYDQNPYHHYTDFGRYNVTLLLTDNEGASDILTKQLGVLSYQVFVDDDFNASTPGWGNHRFNKIQDGINWVHEGGVVYVYSGIYNENIIIDKSINLTGEDRDTTTINGSENEDNTVEISSNWVNISGFCIENSTSRGIVIVDSFTTIDHCIIRNNFVGYLISGWYGDSIRNNSITDCIIANNTYCGVYIEGSFNQTIVNNTFQTNGISLLGWEVLAHWNSHTIENNILNGKPIRYYKNSDWITVPSDTSQVILANCSNVSIQNLNIYNCGVGITLGYCTDITINRNMLDHCIYGILSILSNNSVISGNIITNYCEICIYLAGSHYNNIFGNSMFNNWAGVLLESCSNNKVFHNNFNNSFNAFEEFSIYLNFWDNGYPSGGNYWSDYTGSDNYNGPDQDIPGSDGIGDTPYNLYDDNNQDRYPLMNLWNWTYGEPVWEKEFLLNISAGATINIIANISLNETGEFKFVSTLESELSQEIAEDLTYFYIYEGNTTLTLNTDKEIYKPNEEIVIFGEVTNYGDIPNDYDLSINVDGTPIFSLSFSLNPGETRTFSTNTTQNHSFILAGIVNDLSIAEVIIVEQPDVEVDLIAPDVAGLQPFNIEVMIENIRNVSADINVNVLNNSWNLTIPAKESRLLETTINITENTTLNVMISGDVTYLIQKDIIFGENTHIRFTTQPVYLEGVTDILFTIENIGLLDSEFNATFSIGDQIIERSFFIPVNQNISGSVSFNLTRGANLLRYVSPFEEITIVINVVHPPEFVVTEIYPADMNFIVGENVTLTFVVGNIGGTQGETTLRLLMPDYEETNSTWVLPGHEENLSFYVPISEDLEEKSYKGYYELDDERHEFTFYVYGYNISVDAGLDKYLYEENETAIFTLDITNECPFNLSLYTRVKLSDYEEIQYFNLTDFEMQQFNVPVHFNGNKLFFGIYSESGRALYLNTIYIHKKELITLYTNKQVYSTGENVTIFIDTQEQGILNLTAPGYNITMSVDGSVILNFTVPALRTGTYYIDYTFDSFSSSYPFDVIGYTVRILESNLEEYVYNLTDIGDLSLNIECNQDIAGVLNTLIYDSQHNILDNVSTDISLVEGENTIELSRNISTNNIGIHMLVYSIYADSEGGPIFLASGAEYFDVYDVTSPHITNIYVAPDSQIAGGYVNISCQVTDDVEVEVVKVNISGPPGFTPVNVSMTSDNDQSYYFNQRYTIPGMYSFDINAIDTSGNSETSSVYNFEITMNISPYQPSDPDPYDGETGVDVDHDLSWTGGDPDGDSVTYDVYFGTSSPPPKVEDNQSYTFYDPPGDMEYNTMYYWRIVTWDEHGLNNASDIWHFTTESAPNNPPNTPSNPDPENGETGVDVDHDLSWTGGDPDGDIVTYDVYFGTSSPPPQVAWNQSDVTYDPGTMSYDQIYYWQIVSWDNHGASTVGPEWSFTTGSAPNNPPYVPSSPDPYDGETGVDIDYNLGWTGGDPDPGDIVTYDVYFGTSSPPPQVATGQSGTTYDPGTMSYDQIYYWQIVSWDNHGASTAGPEWDFTTETNYPPVFGSPTPANGSGDQPLSFTWSIPINDPEGNNFEWNIDCSNGQSNGAIGDTNGTKTLALTDLSYSTTYTVWVNATDPGGSGLYTREWYSFTTKANIPPSLGSPNPANGSTGQPLAFTWSIEIFEPDDLIDWSIECSNGQLNSASNDNPGTKSLALSGLSYSTSYTVWVNVTDGYAWVREWFTFTTKANSPPNTPSDPDPGDGETGVDVDRDLSWNCSDPDGDLLTYDVYFEADDPTPDILVSDDQTETTFDPGTLDYETTYYWQIIAEDEFGAVTDGPIWSFTTEDEPPKIPDLDCSGSLSWTDVPPGETVTGNFTVENIGDLESLLDWEVESFPNWGTWTFDPESGIDLEEGDTVTIDVEVVAPDEENTEFTGEIKIVNCENSSDFCIIDVSLATPVSQVQVNQQIPRFMQSIIERYPILRQVLGL